MDLEAEQARTGNEAKKKAPSQLLSGSHLGLRIILTDIGSGLPRY